MTSSSDLFYSPSERERILTDLIHNFEYSDRDKLGKALYGKQWNARVTPNNAIEMCNMMTIVDHKVATMRTRAYCEYAKYINSFPD